MEKFNKTLRGYDPVEVNTFIDHVISQVEALAQDKKANEERIDDLEKEALVLKDKVAQYQSIEETLNKAILMAQKTADQMRFNAHEETELIIQDAKKNASRIINEALMNAEKTEYEVSLLRRNVNIFKRRLKDIVESQIEIIQDIDKVEL
jgi:cell division initiation protein